MIVELILSVIYNLLDILLIFKIPSLSAETLGYVDTFFGYLEAGASILANYSPLVYLLALFGIILVVDSAILIYHFVMWILRKIPMAGIS